MEKGTPCFTSLGWGEVYRNKGSDNGRTIFDTTRIKGEKETALKYLTKVDSGYLPQTTIKGFNHSCRTMSIVATNKLPTEILPGVIMVPFLT